MHTPRDPTKRQTLLGFNMSPRLAWTHLDTRFGFSGLFCCQRWEQQLQRRSELGATDTQVFAADGNQLSG